MPPQVSYLQILDHNMQVSIHFTGLHEATFSSKLFHQCHRLWWLEPIQSDDNFFLIAAAVVDEREEFTFNNDLLHCSAGCYIYKVDGCESGSISLYNSELICSAYHNVQVIVLPGKDVALIDVGVLVARRINLSQIILSIPDAPQVGLIISGS